MPDRDFKFTLYFLFQATYYWFSEPFHFNYTSGSVPCLSRLPEVPLETGEPVPAKHELSKAAMFAVHGLQAQFVQDWRFSHGKPDERGPSDVSGHPHGSYIYRLVKITQELISLLGPSRWTNRLSISACIVLVQRYSCRNTSFCDDLDDFIGISKYLLKVWINREIFQVEENCAVDFGGNYLFPFRESNL